MKRIPFPLLIGVVLSLLLAACGGSVATDDESFTSAETAVGPGQDDEADPVDDPDADNEADDTPDASDDPDEGDATDDSNVTQVRLYFVAPGGGTAGRADPFLVSVQRSIPSTAGIAMATLRELVKGPSSANETLIDGISTSVPAGTRVLGINIADGLATVDLSGEFESGGGSFSIFSRLAQVIYTVTQFPTVDEVEFQLDGQPVTVFSGEGLTMDEPASRADFVSLLPTVFVDTPAAGAQADTPLRITGMGAVFEATFQYRLETIDGTVLNEGFAMTDNGVGWGAFDITLDVSVDTPTEAILTVWEYSAQDGSVQALRQTPLTLLP